MKQTRFIMGMPITIEIGNVKKFTRGDRTEGFHRDPRRSDVLRTEEARWKTVLAGPRVSKTSLRVTYIFKEVFNFFRVVDTRFSPFKKTSELSLMNTGKIKQKDLSSDMKKILKLAKQTKKETGGYFDIYNGKEIDPSGIVKGWAIYEASKILKKVGVKEFFIDAGGDIQVQSEKLKGKSWQIGIRNPFNTKEIIKVIKLKNGGVATSGIYERGNHIYNPKNPKTAPEIVSLTVIGPNVYEADRFATAAFAMGKEGIHFIEKQKNLEGYMIDKRGVATMTSGFERYVL